MSDRHYPVLAGSVVRLSYPASPSSLIASRTITTFLVMKNQRKATNTVPAATNPPEANHTLLLPSFQASGIPGAAAEDSSSPPFVAVLVAPAAPPAVEPEEVVCAASSPPVSVECPVAVVGVGCVSFSPGREKVVGE